MKIPENMNGRVWVYTWGLCNLSCCAPKDMSRAEVERGANLSYPTGIKSCWAITTEIFKGGEPNPTQCEDDPNRQHWLLTC